MSTRSCQRNDQPRRSGLGGTGITASGLLASLVVGDVVSGLGSDLMGGMGGKDAWPALQQKELAGLEGPFEIVRLRPERVVAALGEVVQAA